MTVSRPAIHLPIHPSVCLCRDMMALYCVVAVGVVSGVSNGQAGMNTADTDDELENELEHLDDSQLEVDEAAKREQLSPDRKTLVRMK